MIFTKPKDADCGWVERTLNRIRRHGVIANVTGINTLRPTISVHIQSFRGFPALDAELKKSFASYAIDGDAASGILTVYQSSDYKGSLRDWSNEATREASDICKKLGLSLKAPHLEKSEKPYSISFEYNVRRRGRGVDL
jgi:hypothetical protein